MVPCIFNKVQTMTATRLGTNEQKDFNWVDNSFLVPLDKVDDEFAEVYRTYTSAMGKFTDSSLGGNWVINPIPQFSRYADPRESVLYDIGKNEAGVGGYFQEAIDDNYQKVHMRFGVPSFNNIARFMANCYSIELSSMARTGRAPGALFTIGRAAGTVIALPLALPLMVARAVKFLFNVQSSKYYTLKPTMHNYWSAVSLMVNNIAATLQVVPRPLNDIHTDANEENSPTFDAATRAKFASWLPGIFHTSGMIDMLAVATRAQITSQAFHDQINTYIGNESSPAKRAKLLLDLATKSRSVGKLDINALSLDKYLDEVIQASYNQGGDAASAVDPENIGVEYMAKDAGDHVTYLKAVESNLKAQGKEAAEFVTFRVSNTGAQSESFSTSSKESGIASSINGMTSSAMSTKFDFAYGQTGIGLVDSAITGVKDLIGGALTGIGLEGLGLLAGNAFVDIPKMPDSTSAEINQFSFNIPLRAPYGHDLSRLINEIIPTCCILAGVLPQSTGKHTYTTPLLVEVFCRGRVHIRCGMITSVNITRGTGDIAWLRDGKWMGTDISVTVADMTSVIHMPSHATTGFIGNAIGAAAGAVEDLGNSIGGTEVFSNTLTMGVATLQSGTYDDDSLFSDYMNILGSVEFDIMVSRLANWALRARRQAYNFHQFRSPAFVMSSASSGIMGDVYKAFSERTDRK